MKVIINALNENINTPQRRWWGCVRNNVRYLMRYNHVMLIIHPTFVEKPFFQTITDKRGVSFAIKYLKLPVY